MKAKRILGILMISMLLSTGVLAENEQVNITINGEHLQTDSPSSIVNDSALVPMRAIFEAMGAKVDWEDSTRTVTGTKDSDKIMLHIGDAIASLNENEIALDSPAIIVSDRTLVPVRFIAESLGSDVGWDSQTKTVMINNEEESNEEESNENRSVDDNSNTIEYEVLELVNVERSKVGLPMLEMSEELSAVARMKSKDMADKNYFDHTSPTYGSPFYMMTQFGINYSAAGENIAMGYTDAQGVVNGWMNSPGHKANILSYDFSTLGVGYLSENGNTYWTQMFTD